MHRKQLDPDYNIANFSAAVIILNNGEEIEVKKPQQTEAVHGL